MISPEERENFEYVLSKIRDEGFHYCFVHYSDFPEISDPKFRELRDKYILVSRELEKYIKEKASEEIKNWMDPL
jgi:hypothetical protein